MRQELGFRQRYVSLPQRAWLRHKESDFRPEECWTEGPPRATAATRGDWAGAREGEASCLPSTSSKRESWLMAGKE